MCFQHIHDTAANHLLKGSDSGGERSQINQVILKRKKATFCQYIYGLS